MQDVKKPIDCYKPDERIAEYMKDRTKLNQILAGTMPSRLSNAEKRFYDDIRQRKKRLLEKVIFPSMANLVVFFEKLKDNPELRDEFEDDIKELFGFIRGNTPLQDQSKAGYNERQNIWMRFFESVLTWDIEKDPNNFRLELISELQQMIYYKMIVMSMSILGQEVTNNLVSDDIARARAWTKMLASKYLDSQWKIDSKEMPSKPVLF